MGCQWRRDGAAGGLRWAVIVPVTRSLPHAPAASGSLRESPAPDVTVMVIRSAANSSHGASGAASGPRGAASERRRAARPSLEGSLGSTSIRFNGPRIRECQPDIDGVPDSLTGGSGTATSTAVPVASTGGPRPGRRPCVSTQRLQNRLGMLAASCTALGLTLRSRYGYGQDYCAAAQTVLQKCGTQRVCPNGFADLGGAHDRAPAVSCANRE